MPCHRDSNRDFQLTSNRFPNERPPHHAVEMNLLKLNIIENLEHVYKHLDNIFKHKEKNITLNERKTPCGMFYS